VFCFVFLLSAQTDEERSRGVTTDVAVQHFDTPSKKITLLDAPGHREFIPNMITGAAQADAGILVVPATKGEFEGGFSEDGQIREHAVLARSLGVAQLILAVNKLDTTGWSQSRYNEIVGLMLPYLKSVGYKEKDIWPVPVSGLTGENILERKEEALKSWYSGPVLLDLIDHFALPPRHADRPLRMCVQDVFKTLSLGQAVAGKVECGTILPRDRLLLLPLGETVTVRALESRGEGVNIARAGDNIELGLRDVSDPAVLQVGQWLCDPLHPIPMVTHFRAQIITMNYRVPLLAGSQLHFFNQACSEPVVLRSLQAIVDKVSGTVTKRNPRVLPRQSTAIVEISARNKICLELFRNYKELGRFTLRRGTETVAVGICIKLYRMQ
jgi:elongation factor 1 alpha-like protein